MKKLFFAVLPLFFLLPGCGVRKKNLLNKLRIDMTKEDVLLKMGQPDEIHCPTIHRNGDIEEVWEYDLATVDEAKLNQVVSQRLFAQFVFWPLLFFPSTWESPYEYHSYLLKFLNDHLFRWGKKSEF